VVAAQRQQWEDANDLPANCHDVVMGYDRNNVTNRMLHDDDIDVVSIPGASPASVADARTS